MQGPESDSLWKGSVRESLWGRRGVVKTRSLWLPLAVIISTDVSDGKENIWLTCLQVFAAVACWSLASIGANDIADRLDDLEAGKARWISRLPVGAGVIIVVTLYGLGVLNLLLSDAGTAALGFYLTAMVLALSYSVSPLRLKARGVIGPLAYSFCGAFAYAAMPWAWLGSTWPVLAVLTPAVFLDKWVNLHFHQVVDYEADRSMGTRTFAVSAGLERARLTLKRAAGLCSLSLLAVLVFLVLEESVGAFAVGGGCAAVVLSVALYTRFLKQRAGKGSALVQELSWHYLGLTYAVFRILPIVLFARLALAEPKLWSVVFVVGFLVLLESWYSFRYRYQ